MPKDSPPVSEEVCRPPLMLKSVMPPRAVTLQQVGGRGRSLSRV